YAGRGGGGKSTSKSTSGEDGSGVGSCIGTTSRGSYRRERGSSLGFLDSVAFVVVMVVVVDMFEDCGWRLYGGIRAGFSGTKMPSVATEGTRLVRVAS